MGKIYTSYFANWRNFPADAVPIGITRFKPDYWEHPNLESLAPSAELLRQYRNNYIDEYMFKQIYIQELKDKGFTPEYLRTSLMLTVDGKDVILCCYEKSGEFCHRHILAEWLTNVEEL